MDNCMMPGIDDTLPDDAWKDSFDKLLDKRPLLRELNILKKNVRASFNIDSSVENSNPNVANTSDGPRQNGKLLEAPNIGAKYRLANSISTPCAKRLSADLFHCAISPITGLKLDCLLPPANKVLDGRQNLVADIIEIDISGKALQAEQPRPRKRVCFELSASEKSELPAAKNDNVGRQSRSSIILQPGKWRKSLGNWRRTHQQEGARSSAAKQSLPAAQAPNECSVEFVGIVNLPGKRKSAYIKDEPNVALSFEKQVLKYCGQRKPHRFDKVYAASKMPNSIKIGEGAYGEVFKYTVYKSDVVLKVIPIEGSLAINGEEQKTYEQILPEIIISKAVCSLRDNPVNSTIGFVEILKVALVQGKYPDHLLKLWELYDEEKESENDHPEVFGNDQLFIVLEQKFAGEDMSTFVFLNAEQAYYAFQQILLTLAVGEESYQFEHRDLHWGNILLEANSKKQIAFKLCDKAVKVPTKGVVVTLLDFTLSRITYNEICHYNDLSTDEELFVAQGDYQYDIYRLMRDELKNDWAKFAPKTNIYWLSYIVDKLINGVTYKSAHTKLHKTYLEKLKNVQNEVLNFESAAHFAKSVFKLNFS